MKFKLNAPFARNGKVDEDDVRMLKRALNRLGYYYPAPDIGMNDIPDSELFEAIKSFQSDQGLSATGALKPDDDTGVKIQHAFGNTKRLGKYIWRTKRDDRVRKTHRALEGTIREWDDEPTPGSEPNCRCWAEPLEWIEQEVISPIIDQGSPWEWRDFVKHYYFGNGQAKTLPEMGVLELVIEKSKEDVFLKVQNQVADKARQSKEDRFVYTTSNGYEYQDVIYSLGGSNVKTRTEARLSRRGDFVYLEAIAYYFLDDEFTDIASIRERNKKIGTSSTDHELFEEYKWTEFGGTHYDITGHWTTKITGELRVQKQ